MSTWARSRNAHFVTRSRRRQDAELAVLRERGHSPLEANWRMRIRGDGRYRIRPLGDPATAPSTNGDERLADLEDRKGANPTPSSVSGRRENGSPGTAETEVLLFPAILLASPPEKPVRGPLSWAYWSARRA